MLKNKTWMAVGVASLLGAAVPLTVQAADLVITTQGVTSAAQAADTPPPVPPAPPAAPTAQVQPQGPQGFDNGVPLVMDSRPDRGPRPSFNPGQGPRPIIITDSGRGYAPAFADGDDYYYRHPGWRHSGYYDNGYWQRGDRAYCPRGYRDCMQRMLTDDRYSAQVGEIEKLEDLLYVERNVLRGMQNNPEAKIADLRAQAKTVVDLKNRLDAKYDELMQKYVDDNGDDALPGYYDGRRPHHFMRHHRNWHHY